MIRKVIIVLLSLATVGMGVALTASTSRTPKTTYWKVPLRQDTWIGVSLRRGCFTFSLHSTPPPPTVEPGFVIVEGRRLRPALIRWAAESASVGILAVSPSRSGRASPGPRAG